MGAQDCACPPVSAPAADHESATPTGFTVSSAMMENPSLPLNLVAEPLALTPNEALAAAPHPKQEKDGLPGTGNVETKSFTASLVEFLAGPPDKPSPFWPEMGRGCGAGRKEMSLAEEEYLTPRSTEIVATYPELRKIALVLNKRQVE